MTFAQIGAIKERWENDEQYVCVCGHVATEHYGSADGICGFSWKDGIHLRQCECRESRDQVVAAGRHHLLPTESVR